MPTAAELYVALHSGTPGDVAFYRRACRGARSVLELGCGNGRLLRNLRRPGRVLVGLDQDPEMLQLANARLPEKPRAARVGAPRRTAGARNGRPPSWIRADMASFDLGRRFDAILLPFSGFFCLSPTQKARCLACVVRHLRPGGRFILDAYGGEALRDAGGPREPVVDDFTWIANVSQGSDRYEVFERDLWWPSRQRLDITYSYRSKVGKAWTGELRHWYLFVEQVERLLARHGFTSQRRRISANVPLEHQWALVATKAT